MIDVFFAFEDGCDAEEVARWLAGVARSVGSLRTRTTPASLKGQLTQVGSARRGVDGRRRADGAVLRRPGGRRTIAHDASSADSRDDLA